MYIQFVDLFEYYVDFLFCFNFISFLSCSVLFFSPFLMEGGGGTSTRDYHDNLYHPI